MHLAFRAVSEDEPGVKWQSHFESVWPDYSAWFLREGDDARPRYLTCSKRLEDTMPELVPTWEKLTKLGGGSDQVARMLSLYRPTPYLAGCSQALWTRDEPVLVRNYDYHPGRCEGVILKSAWNGTKVIASLDSLWGALDGLNEHGLAVSLAFGGRREVGDGFGIPLVLRYLLEFCTCVDEAVSVLKRVPSHMAYTVSLLDAAGRSATVFVGPGHEHEVVEHRVATNHQRRVVWREHAELTGTVERLAFLEGRIEDASERIDRFIDRFLEPPLLATSYERAFGTLYTAVYWPRRGKVEFRWPNRSWHQSFDLFVEGVSVIDYP
ncbi:MAG TPA: C45 family peptidase [Vicinamibacteria bacterium]|nr:C45 family peptidase [Vicinamibacteria bacterium]